MSLPLPEAELEHTKMSFGEHLEELRRALFKSLLALLVGVALGLSVGTTIVDYVQEPLRRALREYKQNRAVAKQLAYLEQRQAEGFDVGDDLQTAAEDIVRQGGVPHEYLISPEELATTLDGSYPDLAKALRSAPKQPADASSAANATDAKRTFLPLRLYEPLEDLDGLNTIATNSFEPVTVYLKASFAAGLVFSSPFIFYFVWQFVAAGLYKSERQYVHIFLPLSLTLFLLGAALAYFFAFDYMLKFLFWFHQIMGIDPYPKLSDWITTVVLMPLGFGVSFQLPLVMFFLERVGIFTVGSYLSKWRIAVVVIAIMSMVLTPGTDLNSMLIMFVPLTGLYFLGVAMCKYMPGGSLRSPLRDRPKKTTPEDQAGS